ncbi:MAG TPA: hypothetical protein VFZ09_12630 [Archangium sp.]|uniref:hypothetical protein n=1 Tax=Archangium sp. TaxID=1872627 RepID=UPI002E3705A9|nr:hypothetical protein [Archangium sp.]HEX5747081.1 hypothetical protein [Archangium sp.]
MRVLERRKADAKMSASLPDDEEFYLNIKRGLAVCPHLRELLPQEYPRTSVKREQSLDFEGKRTSRFLHNINLPLALFLAGHPEAHPAAKSVARQMLTEIDVFVAMFANTRGLQKVLNPLWNAPWDEKDPSMWSVIAHANHAIRLRSVGADVREFEAPIGEGGKSADIQFRTKGQDYLLDLEAWHAVSGDTPEAIHKNGMTRAERKAAKKFATLPAGTVGWVYEICIVNDDEELERIGSNQHILSPFKLSETEGCFGALFLICGISNADGDVYKYVLANADTPLPPLRPRSGR